MDELAKAAGAFRAALENTPRAALPVTLQEFPNGACGDATLLLGTYLKTLGFGTFDYVLGRGEDNGETYSHAWLRQGNIIIDITADQFPGQEPLIVTGASPWHDGFEAEVQHEADFHVYDAHTVAMLGAAYAAVMATLEAMGAADPA
ncbi:hypothetical protein IB277_19415 [Ensifer sp. ENS07]|uniref:hypothetical protein n=1 Tax=Ensifer sp. ENS07 TaxID=2769274 RepID=UPI001785F897|nr:hypothetical protein [Ensifer sp. ENS07]MBD9638475.1 hypothetical protein [Ensifer sp. ENS07]